MHSIVLPIPFPAGLAPLLVAVKVVTPGHKVALGVLKPPPLKERKEGCEQGTWPGRVGTTGTASSSWTTVPAPCSLLHPADC